LGSVIWKMKSVVGVRLEYEKEMKVSFYLFTFLHGKL